MPEEPPSVEPSMTVRRRSGARRAPSTAPSKRRPTRYGTIASVIALGALVAAGIMAGRVTIRGRCLRTGNAQHGPRRSRQSRHPAAASTGLERLRADRSWPRAGSGGPSSRTAAHNGLGSGNAPEGSVTLVGPATYTGTRPRPRLPAALPARRRPRVLRRLPATAILSPPSASPGGTTVSAVGSSVATAASQLGSSVPAAASTVSVVNGVVNTLDQAVSSVDPITTVELLFGCSRIAAAARRRVRCPRPRGRVNHASN